MEENQELRWLTMAKAGDNIALTALIEQHYLGVYRYAYKLTFNHHLSEDVTQETFTRFIVHLESYLPKAKLSTYLITIAANIIKDTYRKSANGQKAIDALTVVDALEQVVDLSHNMQIQEALLKLEIQTRSIIVLKEYYGYTIKEIALMLKIPEGTVKSKSHYGLKQIQTEEGYHE